MTAYKKGFSPRIGLSWDPTGSGKLSVRAAYGITYESLASGQGGMLQAPISALLICKLARLASLWPLVFRATFADPFLGETNPFVPGSFPYGITHLTLADDLRPPYAQNWNLTLQREFDGKYLSKRDTWAPKARGFHASSRETLQSTTRLSRTLIVVECTRAAAGIRALAISSRWASLPTWRTPGTTPCN